ncbi:MAG: hypothetical protein WD176_05045 [Pirellulales bacterium]
MTNNSILFCRSLTLVAALACSAPTWAQVPSPPAAPAADVPVINPALTPESNPAIRAALELPRREPADFFQAVNWLIDLGRPDLAKSILDELAAQQLTDVQRAALVDQFGSGAMLKLARTPELAPAGGQFADACMAVAAAAAENPDRIAKLIAQLIDPSSEIRNAARADLLVIGQPGVTATLEALARDADPSRRTTLAAAAVQMDPLVRGPVLAMLDTRDAALRETVVQMLETLEVPQAAPLMPLDSASAEQALLDALRRYCHGTPPFTLDADDQIELWHWDDATKKLAVARYPLGEARTIWMARLARQLAALRPDNRDYQRYAMVLDLEAAAFAANRPSITPADVDSPLLNDALVGALRDNLPRAAVALIDELAKRRDVGVLYVKAPKPSPLADALNHSNRRVRFAALRAIVALDPTLPYPGSSRVPDALAYFTASAGDRRAAVAMPTLERATDLAGKLAAHQLEADGFNNGHAAVKFALDQSDLEFVLVDMNILLPDVRQVVYELRIHPTTGDVPIALLAADGRLGAAEQIAAEHNRVIAVSRPHTPEALAQIVERLQAAAGRDAVNAAERAEQSAEATAWIANLLAADRPFYVLQRAAPVLEAAVYKLPSNQSAVAALVELGTSASQRALVNFASQTTLPVASRAEAVAAFATSVKAHGVLLTTDEIIAQYDRYNASEGADADTQKVFGAILDAIEAPRAANPPPPPWKIPPP